MDPMFTRDFRGPRGYTYLATAGESLLLLSHQEAWQRYSHHKSLGQSGHAKMYETVRKCRVSASHLLGVQDYRYVAFLNSTSQALANFAHSIDLQPGDNIVTTTLDFISNVTAALPFVRQGIDLRVVPAKSGSIEPETVKEYVDDRTRLVIISLVSHWSGYRHDLRVLSKLVRRNQAYLVVDATQALGAIPVEVTYCDFLVASVYKWLLGVPGVALVYCNPEILPALNLKLIGWQGLEEWDVSSASYALHSDSRAFEMGFPNFAGIYILENALQYLTGLGLEFIQQRTEYLVTLLFSELQSQGLHVLTPESKDNRAGIVSIATKKSVQVASRLESLGVYVSAGEDRMRIAPYFYNSEDDIRRFGAALRTVHSEMEGRM